MSRAGSRHRAAGLRHLQRTARRRRQQPEGCRDQGQQEAVRPPSRRGLPHRREDGLPRGLRHHLQPAAVVASAARVLSAHDRLQPDCRPSATSTSFPLATGIPTVPLPDISTGRMPLPRNVEMRTPDPDNVDRGPDAAVERHARAAAPAGHLGRASATSARAPTAATPTST